jgi:hypothetical protein
MISSLLAADLSPAVRLLVDAHAIAKLPIDKPTAIAAALDAFAQRMEEIAVISGSTTATSS